MPVCPHCAPQATRTRALTSNPNPNPNQVTGLTPEAEEAQEYLMKLPVRFNKLDRILVCKWQKGWQAVVLQVH